MSALIAIFSILYIFWPLIILIGIREMFSKDIAGMQRLKRATRNMFLLWCLWAFLLGFIYWQGREPVLILSKELNFLLFGSLGAITGMITLGTIIYHWRKKHIRLSDAQHLEDLLSLSPEDFERLIAELFTIYGYQAQVSGGNSDHGVDVVVTNEEEEKWIVQCKRYSGSVGEPVVRDLFGTMGHEGATRAYLITTGSFTRQAMEWAVGKPIVLYDGEALVKLIRRTQKSVEKKRL